MATLHVPTDLVRDLRASAAAASDLPDGFGGTTDFFSDMQQAEAQAVTATSAETDLGILPEEDEQENEDNEEVDVNAEDGDLCDEAEMPSASAPAVRFALPTLSFAAAAAAAGPAPTLIPSLSSSMQRRSSMPSSTAASNTAAVDSAIVLPLQKVAAGGAKRVVKKEKTKDSKAASTANAPAAATKGVPTATLARSLRGQSVYIAKPAAAVKRGPSARERAGISLNKTSSTSSLHAEEPLSARGGKENPAANGGDVSARRTGVIVSRYMKSSSCATTNSHIIEKTVHLPPQPLTVRAPAAVAAAQVSSASGAATARRSSMTDFPSTMVAARPTTHAGKRRSAAMDHASVVPVAAEAVVESNEGSASKKARHDGLELMARPPFCSPVAESPAAASASAYPQASPEVSALISRKLSFTEGAEAEAPEVNMTDAPPVVLHFAAMEPGVAAAAAAVATVELSSEERDQFVSSLAAKDAELAALRTELAASVARASELDRDNCSTRALLTEAWESEEKYKTLYRELESKHATMSVALESAKADAASSSKKYEVIRTQHDKLQHQKHVLIKRVEVLEKAAAMSGAGGDWDSAASFNFDAAAAASAAAATGIETRRATMAHQSVTHSATGLLSKRK